jgi:hypothetical protein
MVCFVRIWRWSMILHSTIRHMDQRSLCTSQLASNHQCCVLHLLFLRVHDTLFLAELMVVYVKNLWDMLSWQQHILTVESCFTQQNHVFCNFFTWTTSRGLTALSWMATPFWFLESTSMTPLWSGNREMLLRMAKMWKGTDVQTQTE